jgi:HipA-like protein
MNALKSLFRMLVPDEQQGMVTPMDDHAHFNLMVGNMLVGELTLDRGVWSFRYSKHFKHQQEYATLPDFPEKERVYTSDELWPFFVSRIPGLGQPAVQKQLGRKDMEEKNLVKLLRSFGQRSATNPYRLIWETAESGRLSAA